MTEKELILDGAITLGRLYQNQIRKFAKHSKISLDEATTIIDSKLNN